MDNALNSINPINSSNNPLNYMEEILSHQICGFHQYVLTPPVHLNYASCNLCELLGVEKSELLDNSTDLYLQRVHPADREKYSAFIQQIILKEQALTDEYRLVKKDGTIIHVRDTVTPGKLDDGTLIGHSVLADITDLKSENDNLRFLNDTIPCGFIRYTCEKQPKITYINPKMIELLRFPEVKDGEMDYLEMYKSNIFLMVPMEERRRFSKYLNRVFSADAPIAGDMTLLRCDGTRAHVFGWVTKTINEQGEAEFQSVCMDITERYKARKTSESKRYLRALTDVYDKIFEFNLDANTVKCLHCEEASSFKRFENVEMQIEDALKASEYLIVICSPGYKQSVWCLHELETFLELRGPEHVLCVLSEGEPPEVFPDLLRHGKEEVTAEDGTKITVETEIEPLACDYRGDFRAARRTELPRLAAVLLGCQYDELVMRRERYRRRRLAAAFSVTTVLAAAAISWLIWSNAQISKNYRQSLISESRLLAMKSLDEYDTQDRLQALSDALQALPTEERDRRLPMKRSMLSLRQVMRI